MPPTQFRATKIELHLEIQPDFRRRVEFGGQIEAQIGRDAPLAIDQLIELGQRSSRAALQMSAATDRPGPKIPAEAFARDEWDSADA